MKISVDTGDGRSSSRRPSSRVCSVSRSFRFQNKPHAIFKIKERVFRLTRSHNVRAVVAYLTVLNTFKMTLLVSEQHVMDKVVQVNYIIVELRLLHFNY